MIKKIKEALKELKKELPDTFTGKIEINCFKGGISNINILRSYKTKN